MGELSLVRLSKLQRTTLRLVRFLSESPFSLITASTSFTDFDNGLGLRRTSIMDHLHRCDMAVGTIQGNIQKRGQRGTHRFQTNDRHRC